MTTNASTTPDVNITPNASTAPKKKNFWKKTGFIQELVKNKAMFLMLLLPFTLVFVNYYLPMFGVIIAFKNFNYSDGFLGSPWSGLENFKFLFMSDAAWQITRNTILYNLFFIVLGLIFAVLFALALNELRNKFAARLYQSIIFLPYFLSWVVVAYLALAFLDPNGFFNKTIVNIFNLQTVDWYASPQYWPYILVLINLWKNIGYGIVIYIAGISGIDQEYYEAAVLDGASKLQQIRYITIPFLIPFMIVTVIINLGNIFRSDFGLFYQIPMQQGLLAPSTEVLDTYIYKALIMSGDLGMSSAAGLYQSVIGFFTVLIANWAVGKISKENKIF
ncbi:MAG TPA: ABC transporter permease subunit [Pseudobacteroides sp.]|uniref:ABC transporter permease n=1 Tax=Pseudobacteroides sp. TaxID=1968840 RepID=UPI002F9411A8